MSGSAIFVTRVLETPAKDWTGWNLLCRRTLAALIDFMIPTIVVVVLTLLVLMKLMSAGYELTTVMQTVVNAYLLLNALLRWFYFTALEASPWQATVGKKWLGLKVTRLDGNRLSWKESNIRYYAKFLTALSLGVGFLMIPFNVQFQSLHDKVAKTLVQ